MRSFPLLVLPLGESPNGTNCLVALLLGNLNGSDVFNITTTTTTSTTTSNNNDNDNIINNKTTTITTSGT